MDPISLAIATTIAKKGSELVVDRGAEAWRRLVEVVRERLRRDREGEELLCGSDIRELSAYEIGRIAAIVTKLRQEDPTLDEQLRIA